MAISSDGGVKSDGNGSAGTSFSLAPTTTVAVGKILIAQIALDNNDTSDGATSLITSVTDVQGNTYTKLAEYTNGEGSAGAGVTVSLWFSRITTQLSSGNNVTFAFAASITAKVAALNMFSVGASKTLSQSDTAVGNATDASNDFGSAAFSGLSSKERLYYRLLGKEANTTTSMTVSSGFSSAARERSHNDTNAIALYAEFRINTSTGETSNPTLAVSGDTAGVFVALEEADVGGGGGNRRRRSIICGAAA